MVHRATHMSLDTIQKDANSWHQPFPSLDGWDNLDLSELTLGVYWPWFRHASEEIISTCEWLLEKFKNMGAKVREVVIPDLEAGRVAHVITIAVEMAQALSHTYAKHHRQHGQDVRINLALGRALTGMDYM